MPVDGPQYPVMLDVRGRPCLVVGGGSVAAGKVESLNAAAAAAIALFEAVRQRSS